MRRYCSFCSSKDQSRWRDDDKVKGGLFVAVAPVLSRAALLPACLIFSGIICVSSFLKGAEVVLPVTTVHNTPH
jgi:hypothetical protein